MTLGKGFATTSASTSLDARLIEQALLVKNGNGSPQVGVLHGNHNPLMSTPGMTLIVTDQVVVAPSHVTPRPRGRQSPFSKIFLLFNDEQS